MVSVFKLAPKVIAILISLAILLLTGCTPAPPPAEPVSPTPAVSQAPAIPVALPTAPSPAIDLATKTEATLEVSSLPSVTPTVFLPVTPTPTLTVTFSPEVTTPFNLTPCSSEEPAACQIEHVVLISIDGLRPDALAEADTPTLDTLIAAGAYSPAAQAVLPSVTLVNHASMLSGMTPEKHGIYWNETLPNLGKVEGPTLFSAAHEAGLETAMVVGKPKLDHLVLPNSVDTYIYAGFLDRQVVDRTVAVIQAGLPDLLFVHLPDVDSAGHLTGWMSTGQLLAIEQTDRLIAELLVALEAGRFLNNTLLLVVSDHGGRETWHGDDSPEETTVPWLAVGPGVPAGLTLQAEIMMYDTAATALYALGVPVPERWDGRPVLEAFGQNLPGQD